MMTNWKPKKWLAILLGFFVPSLGMLYMVRVRLAAAYFLAGLVAGSLDLWMVFSQAPWGHYLFFGWTLMAIGAVHSYWLVRQNRVIPIRPWYSRWYSLLALPIVLTVMIFSFRAFLFEPFRMPSGSMLPSINPGDIPVVSKWGYGHYATFGITLARSGLAKEIKRGEVVVFASPKDPSIDYVKRVVGLPGDTIGYDKDSLSVNGKPAARVFAAKDPDVEVFSESLDGSRYQIQVMPAASSVKGSVTVPAGAVFVMGDNRDNSNDSRFFGPVPLENIVGKVVYIVRAGKRTVF
ncbi:signal peptidase I [Methylovulum psychrotolerans]|uniref:Signal peptidase I n=1 Tax=Methylovulum psychrotolerans TaxID=1704499 RepID=A0A2S5CL92_9GAMM|nr:signal peptidase I [Methylovulum psychrotolerans]POZ51512.1 signal peptidase I [Methylovulum psychrotolerans]